MKKILSLLLCLSLILAFTGCSKIDETWKDIKGETDFEPEVIWEDK